MDVQELVGLVPWTFVAQICNLFIQMYLIKRFLFKPVNDMLEKRRALADAQIREAEQAKAEKAVAQAQAKAEKTVAQAQAKAKKAAKRNGNKKKKSLPAANPDSE